MSRPRPSTLTRDEPRGLGTLSDADYVRGCYQQLRDELPTLLLATGIVLVPAAPWLLAVVVGLNELTPLLLALLGAPAWAALVAVAAAVARGEAVALAAVAATSRRLYGRAAAVGAGVGGFAWAFERALRLAGDDVPLGVPALALALAGLAVVLAAAAHAFPLLALADPPLIATVRLALTLAVIAPGATLAMIAAGAIALVALGWLGPGTLLATLPVLAVLQVNNTRVQLTRLEEAHRGS